MDSQGIQGCEKAAPHTKEYKIGAQTKKIAPHRKKHKIGA